MSRVRSNLAVDIPVTVPRRVGIAARNRKIRTSRVVLFSTSRDALASPPPAGGGDARASLEVENNTTLDVRIFLLRAAMPTRLGTVTGMSTARFDLTLDMLGRDVRFYASPVGGGNAPSP